MRKVRVFWCRLSGQALVTFPSRRASPLGKRGAHLWCDLISCPPATPFSIPYPIRRPLEGNNLLHECLDEPRSDHCEAAGSRREKAAQQVPAPRLAPPATQPCLAAPRIGPRQRPKGGMRSGDKEKGEAGEGS